MMGFALRAPLRRAESAKEFDSRESGADALRGLRSSPSAASFFLPRERPQLLLRTFLVDAALSRILVDAHERHRSYAPVENRHFDMVKAMCARIVHAVGERGEQVF